MRWRGIPCRGKPLVSHGEETRGLGLWALTGYGSSKPLLCPNQGFNVTSKACVTHPFQLYPCRGVRGQRASPPVVMVEMVWDAGVLYQLLVKPPYALECSKLRLSLSVFQGSPSWWICDGFCAWPCEQFSPGNPDSHLQSCRVWQRVMNMAQLEGRHQACIWKYLCTQLDKTTTNQKNTRWWRIQTSGANQ